MIRNVLSNIGGIGIYGVISICLFFAVFIGTLIWAIRLKAPFLQAMGQLPLHDEAVTGDEATADANDRFNRSNSEGKDHERAE